MFGLSTLYLRLAGIASIALAVLGLWLYVGHLKSDVQKYKTLYAEQEQVSLGLTAQLRSVTDDKAVVDKKATEAGKARDKIAADLVVTLKKLKTKPAPVDCPAQIDWLYENSK